MGTHLFVPNTVGCLTSSTDSHGIARTSEAKAGLH